MEDTSPRPLPPRVGRYEILLPIASGGMATVYLARSHGARGFEREVALKLTHAHLAEGGEFAAILLEEGNLAARIRHQNVVSILDVGEDPLGLFLVMEYVEGDTLSNLQRRKTSHGEALPVPIGIRILLDALAGLHAAHELCDEHGVSLNVVHRDFSPQNILVGLDGVAQLTDFGVAKAANSTQHTDTGVVKGKVAYMAPEQARGLKIDRRADVWAAGVVAWEVLAGQRLYPSGDGVATLLRLVSERPALLRTVAPQVPAEVERVVAGALEPDTTRRIASAAEFARQLAQACAVTFGVAESAAVAAYVQTTAGPKLVKRREQVAKAAKLRAKMDALASASIDASSGNSSGAHRSVGRAPMESELSVRVELDDGVTQRMGAAPAVPESLASSDLHTDRTESASTSEAGAAPRRSRALVLLLAGAGLVLVLLGTAAVVRRASAPAPVPPTVAAPPVAAPIVAAPAAPPEPLASGAAAAVPAPEPPPTTTPRAPAVTASTPAVPARPGRRISPPLPPTPPAAKADCDPPYTLDADGVRIPKRHCF